MNPRKPSTRHRAVVQRAGPAYVPCGECLSGWITVFEEKPGWTVPIPAVKRCWCWIRHQERLTETAGASGGDA